MRKLGHNVYFHQPKPGVGVAITFGNDAAQAMDASVYTDTDGKPKGVSGDYVPRGTDDNKLLRMHKLATESPNKWQLITTRASFIGGWGFGLFDRLVVDNKEKQVPFFSTAFDDWHERLDLSDYHQSACYQAAFSNELNIRLTLGTDKKVIGLEVIDNNEIRAERPVGKETKVKRYWISALFGFSKSVKKDKCLILPAFDPSDPTKFPVSVIHVIKRIPGQKYNGLAEWWGSEKWTTVSNSVPDFYDAAFTNGFFVTHQVSFPDDYFDVEGLDDEAREKLKETTLLDLTDTLSGIEKGNKIFITFSKLSADGKSTKEVKIVPLANPINDEAFIKMFSIANQVQASSHGVQGQLAGVDLGNGMGTSGKELATAADYMQDYLTFFDREMILKAVRIAKKIDGLEPTKLLNIKRIESYTYDVTAKNKDSNQNQN